MAFGRKTKTERELAKGIQPCGAVTMLSEGSSIEGTLNLSGDIRIDGAVKGDVACKKKVVIGNKGSLVGDIDCEFLELHGKVTGNIVSKKAARLHSSATLKGDLYAPQFSIDMGATFIGMSKGQKIASVPQNQERE